MKVVNLFSINDSLEDSAFNYFCYNSLLLHQKLDRKDLIVKNFKQFKMFLTNDLITRYMITLDYGKPDPPPQSCTVSC